MNLSFEAMDLEDRGNYRCRIWHEETRNKRTLLGDYAGSCPMKGDDRLPLASLALHCAVMYSVGKPIDGESILELARRMLRDGRYYEITLCGEDFKVMFCLPETAVELAADVNKDNYTYKGVAGGCLRPRAAPLLEPVLID